MWWKQAGELVAGYYKQRAEVEKDVEGAFFGPTDWGLMDQLQLYNVNPG